MRHPILLLFAALFALQAGAHAQTSTTANAALVQIVHQDGTTNNIAVNNQWYINRHDCVLDVYTGQETQRAVKITVNVAAVTSVDFGAAPQLWVGSQCENSTNRAGGANATCFRAVGINSENPVVRTNGSTYEISLSSFRPGPTVTSPTAYDICDPSRTGTLDFYLFRETEGTDTTATYVKITLTGDMSAPSTVAITSDNPQGDNAITFEWTSNNSIEAFSSVEFFVQTGGCGVIGGDAGTADAGSSDAGAGDAGTADAGSSDGGVTAGSTGVVAGAKPPLRVDGVIRYAASSGSGTTRIESRDIGLRATGDAALVGMAVKDVAGNYSVVSNVVCAQRITTYGLCETAGDCPQGSCTVSTAGSGGRTSLAFAGAALGLLALACFSIRRGGRP